MKKLTTSYPEFLQQVKSELRSFDAAPDEECILTYSEFPSIGGGHFSLFLVNSKTTHQLKLIKKIWDFEQDITQISLGIYNLERIRTQKNITHLSEQLQKEIIGLIQDLTTIPEAVTPANNLVLDGVECQFTLKKDGISKSYAWRISSERPSELGPLIDLLKASMLAGTD